MNAPQKSVLSLKREPRADSDAPALWDEALRGIDAARPHRPLFSGRG